jgi:Na+-transporting NADH:ubiquinone oxidoreductase subunit A
VYALQPADYHGLIPKLMVKEGEEVKAGTPLFYDKSDKRILFASPVSGEVVEIRRGDKRRIMEVKVLADRQNRYEEHGAVNLSSISSEDLKEKILQAGLWPTIKQRPYDVIASPDDTPKAIFISGFDSSPLAPDPDFVIKGKESLFQKGLDGLKVLAGDKKVYLGIKKGSSALKEMTGAEINEFSGPHPVGNVGVHIHKLAPINKGEVVWTVAAQDVINLGRFFETGKYDVRRTIALAGSEVQNAKYFDVIPGAMVKSVTKGNLKDTDKRIISGNVLTGASTDEDGFIGFYDNMITVLPEGDEPKFFLTKGWLGPGLDKFSISHAFPTWLMPGKKYKLDTNMNGERRAFVVTGQYERVFPFDIYPVQLVKSIMVNDIEQMENLGIYEVAPEDFALCEYVCTSKIPVQSIVREGLDTMLAEFK